MGRFERKIKRRFTKGMYSILIWIVLAPFKLLIWITSSIFKSFTAKPKKYINSNGYIVLSEFNELEHRYLAKQKLDRDLRNNEVVHHINGRKTDNNITNLCVMDSEKHEHFHSWLKWKKEKTGNYPSINKQKKVLESEYGGILIEKLCQPIIADKAIITKKENKNFNFGNEFYPARKNKLTRQYFLEFEEEQLISPDGRIIEIDNERFEDTEEVELYNFTDKQVEIYNNKLNSYEKKTDAKVTGDLNQRVLFSELKKERLKIARENQVPAYIIFHDSTLMEMAQVMPVSESLMLQIQGVGPEKMAKYGIRFINVIKKFNTNSEEESA